MITVAGEALIDLVDEGGGRYRAHPGGSPANTAVGLARLGVPCSMLARISTDAFDGRLARHLAGNGVSLRDVVQASAGGQPGRRGGPGRTAGPPGAHREGERGRHRLAVSRPRP